MNAATTIAHMIDNSAGTATLKALDDGQPLTRKETALEVSDLSWLPERREISHLLELTIILRECAR